MKAASRLFLCSLHLRGIPSLKRHPRGSSFPVSFRGCHAAIILTLHGVIHESAEERRRGESFPEGTRRFPGFQSKQQCSLLMRLKIGEDPAVEQLTRLVNAGESVAVLASQVLKRAAKLAIDVVDHAGPYRAGVLVGRNDLVDYAGQGAGFIDGKESPRRPAGFAGTGSSGDGSSGERGLQERAVVETDGRLHRDVIRLDCRSPRLSRSVMKITDRSDEAGRRESLRVR